MSAVDELTDDILPAQSVYAQAVVAAELQYQAAVKRAWQVRKTAIDEALTTCLIALKQAPERSRED